jgi:5-methylcytosine-specific restriction protein A
MKTLKRNIPTLKATIKPLVATERIRGSALQKIRKAKLLANPACELCLAKGMVTLATEVDHKMPLWAGGKETDSNRQSLCTSCHLDKTKKEAKMRANP